MEIDYSKVVNLTNEMLYEYLVSDNHFIDIKSVTIKNYEVVGNNILISYSERRVYLGVNIDHYYYNDVYEVSILDYISFVQLYTMEKLEALFNDKLLFLENRFGG